VLRTGVVLRGAVLVGRIAPFDVSAIVASQGDEFPEVSSDRSGTKGSLKAAITGVMRSDAPGRVTA
jgi:hypothetical protein